MRSLLSFALLAILLAGCALPQPQHLPHQTATPTPVPPRPGLALIFSDEFAGGSLDTAKWSKCYPWDNGGCTNAGNHEEEWYLPGEVLLESGLLRLRARQEPVTGSDGKKYPYTSGMISSYGKFSTAYGYFEIRTRLPKGKGLWPAFWLLPASGEWPPEIDILEALGSDTRSYFTTLHYKTAKSPHLYQANNFAAPADLSEGFHIYAVNWQPNQLTWYFDGQQVYQLDENVPSLPMYILANLAVGGDFPGPPSPDTAFPAFYDIDYIRVYR